MQNTSLIGKNYIAAMVYAVLPRVTGRTSRYYNISDFNIFLKHLIIVLLD